LLMFDHSGEKSRYGKNARLLQACTAGPCHVTLAWGYLVAIPRPTLLQPSLSLALTCDNEPQGAGSGQE
jgi:hypothetical protein